MGSSRPLRWYDAISINIYYTGLTTLSQTMLLIIPLLVQQFVGETNQGAAVGSIRLWSLMVALLVQSLMGMLSDRNVSPWGRRRPFILTGTIFNLAILGLIGFTAGMDGAQGYWSLFCLVILYMIAANTAHGAVQGLIPDLVPANQRGLYSGVKALLEVPIPLILVSFTIGRLISHGNLWGGLLVCMSVLLFTMLVSMFVPEKPLQAAPGALDWRPFLRLVAMTAVFTLIILGAGQAIRWLGILVQDGGRLSEMALLWAVGLAAMLAAIAAGVFISVRISTGARTPQNTAFTWWVVNRLAFLVGSTNIATFAIFFLQGRLGLVRAEAAGPATRLMLVVGVFILLLALPAGWLADRVGRKLLVALSGLTAALGTLVIIAVPNLNIIYLGGILVGAATGLFYTANWALGTDLTPADQAGRYLGISNLAGAGAGAVGAYIGGPIADYFTVHAPDTPGLGYVVLFAIYGALFLLSVVALTRIRIPEPHTPGPAVG